MSLKNESQESNLETQVKPKKKKKKTTTTTPKLSTDSNIRRKLSKLASNNSKSTGKQTFTIRNIEIGDRRSEILPRRLKTRETLGNSNDNYLNLGERNREI